MNERNIFEEASRLRLRFETTKGLLTTEDLWALPLTSTKNVNLDRLEREARKAVRGAEEESFVSQKPSDPLLQLRLDILRHVITWRMDQNKQKLAEAERLQRKQKLQSALGRKQDAALEQMSEEEIQAELNRL